MADYFIKGGSRYNEANPTVWCALILDGYDEGLYTDEDWKLIGYDSRVNSDDPFWLMGSDTGGAKEFELGLYGNYRIKFETTGITYWDGDSWEDLLAEGGANTLNELTDVVIDAPADNELLSWDTGTSKWINQTQAEAGLVVALDDLANPSGDKEFNFANKHLHFKWVAPASGAHEGAFEIEASGAFSGDLIHIHQHTGNVGANTYMVFIECEDDDASCLHLEHGGDSLDFGDNGLKVGADARITEFDTDVNLAGGNTKVPTDLAVLTKIGADILTHKGGANEHHIPTVKYTNGEVDARIALANHDVLQNPNGNAEEQHLTSAQQGALHAIYQSATAHAYIEANALTMTQDITFNAGQTFDGKDVSTLGTDAEAHAYVEANALTMTQDIVFNAGQTFDGKDVSGLCTVAEAINAVESTGLVLDPGRTINIDATPNNASWTGIAIDISTVGCSLFDLVYVDGPNSVLPADADNNIKMPAIGIVVQANRVLIHGVVKDDDLIVCTTAGAVVYASTTLRKVTETAPNGVGNMIQVVGVCVGDHTLLVNPSQDMVKFKA